MEPLGLFMVVVFIVWATCVLMLEVEASDYR